MNNEPTKIQSAPHFSASSIKTCFGLPTSTQSSVFSPASFNFRKRGFSQFFYPNSFAFFLVFKHFADRRNKASDCRRKHRISCRNEPRFAVFAPFSFHNRLYRRQRTGRAVKTDNQSHRNGINFDPPAGDAHRQPALPPELWLKYFPEVCG